ERDRVPGARARHVPRRRIRRLDHGHLVALRSRRDPKPRRHRRLHGRAERSQGLRPRGARGSQAAALPQAVQAGGRPAVPVLDPVPPRPLRDAVLDRTCRPLRRQPRPAARRAVRRGLRRREARPRGRRGARRLRHVHDLRRGCEQRRDGVGPLPPRGARRGLPADARRREGRRPHLRRRRAARGQARRPAPRRAVRALPQRGVAERAACPRDTRSRAVKVVIFSGGLGLRMGESTARVPKPMIPIGDRPILWHIMRYYSSFGYNDFVLCLGYRAEVVKEYFLNYQEALTNDFVRRDGGREVELLSTYIHDWSITFANTGLRTSIGQRLKAVESHIGSDDIFLTNYGDTLTDAPIPDMVDALVAADKIALFIA